MGWHDQILVLSLAVAGAALGFLPYNFPRGRLFMGDVGSLSLGFLLSGLAAHDLPVLGPCERIPELVTEYALTGVGAR